MAEWNYYAYHRVAEGSDFPNDCCCPNYLSCLCSRETANYYAIGPECDSACSSPDYTKDICWYYRNSASKCCSNCNGCPRNCLTPRKTSCLTSSTVPTIDCPCLSRWRFPLCGYLSICLFSLTGNANNKWRRSYRNKSEPYSSFCQKEIPEAPTGSRRSASRGDRR